MGNSIKSNTTFWTEISEYRILVPYYQRDYAQGRIDGGRIDNIRKVFVEELYRAINVTDEGEDKRTCHLGLVFGSYDDAKTTFIAVDGQQRLTTVFLFYWYVAWREGKLSDFKVLSTNFSWNTRSYSSQFVDLLFKIDQANNVIETIKSSSDYFSIWENDPTVKGMLTMLEEIESQYPRYKCNLCDNLFSNNCNIRYDILKLEKDSDSKTYLKMNSRGRSLTTFELFKSKFIDYYKPLFAKQFDEEWLTFMLEMSRDETGGFVEPDISYMNLINEYTYLMLRSKDIGNTKRYDDFIAAKLKGNLTDIPFIGFERYKIAFDGNTEHFEKVFNWIIANYETIEIIDAEQRFPESKFFLKEIIKSNDPNFSHRTKLFSLIKFAKLIDYANVEEELFRKWNRVFRNLVENTDIDSSNFGNICKAIDRINNGDIYSYLISDSDQLTYFDNGQVKEEKAKAEQILNDKSNNNDKLWENVIKTAESFAFFRGSIRFLYLDENGSPNWNWAVFDKKWINAQSYFDVNGVSEKYQKDSLLIRYFISKVKSWGDLLGINFDNTSGTWKKILTSNRFFAIDKVLMSNSISFDEYKPLLDPLDCDDKQISVQNELVKTNILDYTSKLSSKLNWRYGNYCLYPYNTKSQRNICIIANKRNKILSSLCKEDKISSDNEIVNSDYFWGWDIIFKYPKFGKSYNFQWNTDNHVYLLIDGRPVNRDDTKDDLSEKLYCFGVSGVSDEDALLQRLDQLINQYVLTLVS
ncbi:MAG: DUF262 domain-containing protein [Muribaculaceae bacterium]|nr:DUF262 domain-containing protein [Muribaculaceae bacterium]